MPLSWRLMAEKQGAVKNQLTRKCLVIPQAEEARLTLAWCIALVAKWRWGMRFHSNPVRELECQSHIGSTPSRWNIANMPFFVCSST